VSPEQIIAHYRIVSKLGEGGMGAVYRATDTKLGRDVAIEVLPEAFAQDAGRMARFEREAQVLASLNHPNIAQIYGIEQGALIMELVEGADLAGPVPLETAIEYARQIAAGLEAAHEKGIVHRDLKPANIKVTPDRVVKLLDFGLAKAQEDEPANTGKNARATGRRLAFHQSGANTGRDLWILPLDTTDAEHPRAGTPELFFATKGNDMEPAFSPDGQWLAYSSDESGRYQVFVRPFPEGAKGGGQAQVSTTSGTFPVWSRTAKAIFYVANDGHIMVVPYTINGRNFEPGKPRQWTGSPIRMTGNVPPYDLGPDGRRLVGFPAPEVSAGGEKVNLHMTFLPNFFDELKRRVPVGGGK
jgi:serine/threonine protein kinase